MRTKINLLLLLIIPVMLACSKSENRETDAYVLAEYEETPESSQRTDSEGSSVEIVKENIRKLIKQGNIVFETNDVSETKSKINNTVALLGGYISRDNITMTESRITHSIEIRIESEKFDQLLNQISETASKIESKTIDVLDVTEEFIDTEARIKTKKEVESRFRKLLKMAKSVDEILRIEREIGNVRNEIESAEGRLRYLKDRVSFSTLNIEYYQKLVTSINFFDKVINGIVQGWELLLYFFIGLSYIWPFIIIPLAVIFIIKYVRKSNKAKK
ncbi:MAG: DUF4349 domain-containing protein [Bacteroidetes bacterium]|nr:DUF4349 domain-containing protein [Bacteroidota bacterium]